MTANARSEAQLSSKLILTIVDEKACMELLSFEMMDSCWTQRIPYFTRCDREATLHGRTRRQGWG